MTLSVISTKSSHISPCVFLSRRPGRIKKIYEIKMEHPRNRNDPEFEDLVSEIIGKIGKLEND